MTNHDERPATVEPEAAALVPSIEDLALKVHSIIRLKPAERVVINTLADLALVLRLHGIWLGSLASPPLPVQGQRACLSGADLRGAALNGMDLRAIDFSGADLEGASLAGANLAFADLSGANLRRADLRGADLDGATLIGATFEESIRA